MCPEKGLVGDSRQSVAPCCDAMRGHGEINLDNAVMPKESERKGHGSRVKWSLDPCARDDKAQVGGAMEQAAQAAALDT